MRPSSAWFSGRRDDLLIPTLTFATGAFPYTSKWCVGGRVRVLTCLCSSEPTVFPSSQLVAFLGRVSNERLILIIAI
jgi:hypothetical protein